MSIVAKKIMMGSGAVALPSDDQFNRTSFLSHFDGSNDGVNNQFTDGSANNHTITANGNVTQGSFGPFARPDGEWAVDFEDGDSLAVASSSDFDFGTSNFTWECFVFQKSRSAFQLIMAQDDYSSGNSISCWLTDTGQASIYYEGGGTHFTTTATVPLNTWTHLAWVRKGTGTNEFSIYINGTAEVSGTMTTSFDQDGIIIGQQANGSYDFIGNISNIRIVNGSAVYTGNFTTPTSKLTAVTNTKLLTCQSNRFVDNSASGHTVTPAGNAAVSAFGPFLTSKVYSAGRNGASVYMDGASDYLSLSASNDFDVADGDITIECWVYRSAADTTKQCVWEFYTDDNNLLRLFYEGNKKYSLLQRVSGTDNFNVSISGTASLNEWSHLAVTRSSSGTYKLYINGVENISQAEGVTINTSGIAFYVGVDFYATDRFWNGYICDFRIVKGSLVYSSNNFTPPTAPLTAITNTKLLLNMADGQAIDSAAQNNLTLYGNAKISTGQAKFGNTSMVFDGTGDYFTLPSSSFTPFGAGDFTIECFARFDAINGKGLFQLGASYLPSAVTGPAVFASVATNNPWRIYYGTSDADASVSPSADTWYHVAYVRSSGVTKLYVDGTSVISQNDTTNYTNTFFVIGGGYSSSFLMDGYIDEFRISHMARYTSNFTAPTKAFADKGQ